MPFAGDSCKVDILNPHGDAAYPLKVVSFVRTGQLHVGVVSGESSSAFVGSVLAELAATVEELTSRRPHDIFSMLTCFSWSEHGKASLIDVRRA